MRQCECSLNHREKWRGCHFCYLTERTNWVTQWICDHTWSIFFFFPEMWALTEILKYVGTYPHINIQLMLLGRKKQQKLFTGSEPMSTSTRINNRNPFTEQKIGQMENCYIAFHQDNSFFKHSIESTLHFELSLASIYLFSHLFLSRRNNLKQVWPPCGWPSIMNELLIIMIVVPN